MPTTKTIELYEYDELSPKAQAVAIDWYRQLIEPDDYAEYIVEELATEIGPRLGITVDTHTITTMGGKTRQEPSVYWALHVQGAGAAFPCRWAWRDGCEAAIRDFMPTDEAMHAIAAELGAGMYRGYSARITVRDVHDWRIEVFDAEDNEVYSGHVYETLCATFRDLFRWLYQAIDAEYDYQTKDETIAERLKDNAYTFRANGKREDL